MNYEVFNKYINFCRTLKLKEVENHIKLSDHPNIVTLYDAWEEDRLLYMLMELCNNNVSKIRVLSEDECWNVLIDTTLVIIELECNVLYMHHTHENS